MLEAGITALLGADVGPRLIGFSDAVTVVVEVVV